MTVVDEYEPPPTEAPTPPDEAAKKSFDNVTVSGPLYSITGSGAGATGSGRGRGR
jgi:hypothetical protein